MTPEIAAIKRLMSLVEAGGDPLEEPNRPTWKAAVAAVSALSAALPQPVGVDREKMFDLDRSYDPPSSQHAKASRDLWNVIDWRGEHRGQVALTYEEAYAIKPLRPAATTAAQPSAVAVKPLDWHETGRMAWHAHSALGVYQVLSNHTQRDDCWRMDRPGFLGEVVRESGTLAEAKAAAQADFEARIRSCLSTLAPSAAQSDEARVTALEKALEPFAEQWAECERYNREWPRAPREAYRLAHASLSPKPGDEKP